MSTIKDIFSSPDGGHSGKGISYYSSFDKCPRRGVLEEQAKAMSKLTIIGDGDGDGEEAAESSTGIGTLYHKLQEAAERGNTLLDHQSNSYSKDQGEALRLFRGWRNAWGSLQAKYGCTIEGLEYDLGSPEGDVEGVGGPLTGRIDFVGYWDEFALEMTFANTGLRLPGPGRYIGDYKTAKQRSTVAAEVYAYSISLENYAYLWNLKFPDKPCLGSVVDEIYRHKELDKVKSFGHYFAPIHEGAVDRLRNYVQTALERRASNVAVPTQCIQKMDAIKICPFLGRACNRC